MRLKEVTKATLVGTILQHTDESAHIMTDEHAGYKSVSTIRKHDSVNHIKEEWVRGNVHTNSIENYWSLFKRGLIGAFHQVSVKHLERYMAEFDYRFNNRKDTDIFIKTIARMCRLYRWNSSSLLLTAIPPIIGLWDSVSSESLLFSPATVLP